MNIYQLSFPTANPGIVSFDAGAYRLLHTFCTLNADVSPSPRQAMQKSVAKGFLLLNCLPPRYPVS